MCLNTNICMKHGSEPLPQGKPNSSFEGGLLYPWVVFGQVQDMEKLQGLFQITISGLPDRNNKI